MRRGMDLPARQHQKTPSLCQSLLKRWAGKAKPRAVHAPGEEAEPAGMADQGLLVPGLCLASFALQRPVVLL